MDMKLELVVVPVADVDRAKAFYVDRVGFHLDVDHRGEGDFRVVQMTPPGSACSITVMSPASDAAGSLQGLHLVVSDIEAARAELVGRGVDVSPVFHCESGFACRYGEPGEFGRRAPGPQPQRATYASFATFADPDGNEWVLQEITTRLPGR